MLVSEFIDRTGYQPSAEEYAEIERAYMRFAGNKDEFCKEWCNQNPDKASELDRIRKKHEYISGQEERTIGRVLKHIWKRTNHGEKISREQFAELIKGLDGEIARRTIKSMKDWHGITQSWQGSVWQNYWQVFECVAYGY